MSPDKSERACRASERTDEFYYKGCGQALRTSTGSARARERTYRCYDQKCKKLESK